MANMENVWCDVIWHLCTIRGMNREKEKSIILVTEKLI